MVYGLVPLAPGVEAITAAGDITIDKTDPRAENDPVQSSPSMGVDTFNSAWCPYGFCGTALTFHEDFSKN